ncbi:hypothetical protein BOTBODRAFT_178165 [Botryobasidium botryosum FD-172 SS1]|uniref:Uncharacterized protein n=1 Tax=Botryobasidium botryosum (strain FD-172 SS1) TaxID=930990 RepID=A0A067M402_BOTB1|nr:hypothetical protein BOTBODRAFT_178165 [Botryobasidium botryosum FD-172 SS1]
MVSLTFTATVLSAIASIVLATPVDKRACAGVSRWSSGVYYDNGDHTFRNQVSATLPCPAGDRQVKLSVIDLATCEPIVTSLGTTSETISGTVSTIDYPKNIFLIHSRASSEGTPITLTCVTQPQTNFGVTAEFISASWPGPPYQVDGGDSAQVGNSLNNPVYLPSFLPGVAVVNPQFIYL